MGEDQAVVADPPQVIAELRRWKHDLDLRLLVLTGRDDEREAEITRQARIDVNTALLYAENAQERLKSMDDHSPQSFPKGRNGR